MIQPLEPWEIEALESLGVDFGLNEDKTVLTIRFKNGTCEHWLGVPGPVERHAGKEVLKIGDRVFIRTHDKES